MNFTLSLQIVDSVLEQLLDGVADHIKTQQILKLMDKYAMKSTSSLLNQVLTTFARDPQTLNPIQPMDQPPRVRIDSLATTEIKTGADQGRSILHESITDNDPKKITGLKRKGSSLSNTVPHKFNKSYVNASVPLDLEKIENEKRGQPIVKKPDYAGMASREEKNNQLEKRNVKKMAEEFTFEFNGTVLPIESIHPKISVSKANYKLGSINVETKGSKVVEIGSIKPQRLDKKLSKVPAQRKTGINFSQSNIPLPLDAPSNNQQKGVSYKDFSENKGGKFKRISMSSEHSSLQATARDILEPEKYREQQKPRYKQKAIESKRSSEQEIANSKHLYQKAKFTLPKLKGKYNPMDSISNRIM